MMTELFHRVARPAILAASRWEGLRRTSERLPVTRDVVHRFVPGETVADVMNSVEQLRYSERLVSIDYLGEDVTDVNRLWGFGVQQADNALSSIGPTLASATDDSIATPGSLSLSFTRL